MFKTTLLDSGDLRGHFRWKLYIDYFYDHYTITLYVIKLFNNLLKSIKDELNLQNFKNMLKKSYRLTTNHITKFEDGLHNYKFTWTQY